MMKNLLIFLGVLAIMFPRRLAAVSLTHLVRVRVNVETGSATCNDWFVGNANTEYLAALATYNLGQTPAVSCQQAANTVHQIELISAEPGPNMLFDDPRKVTEAVLQLRNKEVTNRVSLYVDFFFTAPDATAAQNIFGVLNANVRSGDFLGKVEKASVPLLMANVVQEVVNQGIGCSSLH